MTERLMKEISNINKHVLGKLQMSKKRGIHVHMQQTFVTGRLRLDHLMCAVI